MVTPCCSVWEGLWLLRDVSHVGTPLQDWSLMCPNECPGLDEVWGEEFEKLYERYEKTANVVSIGANTSLTGHPNTRSVYAKGEALENACLTMLLGTDQI